MQCAATTGQKRELSYFEKLAKRIFLSWHFLFFGPPVTTKANRFLPALS